MTPLGWLDKAKRLAWRASRSDAAIWAFFFLWNLLWLREYLRLPLFGDAAAYVSVHTYNIYLHPWLPFVTGDFDVGHPTLLYWIAALAWRVFGVSVAVGRIVHLALGAVLLLYVHKTGRRLGLGGAAFWTALMTSWIPILASQTVQFNLDIPYTAFFVAATYYFLRKNRPGRFVLFASAMVLSKLTGFLLLAPMMVLAFSESVRERGLGDWRSHLRRTWLLGVPLVVLAVFCVVRYLATGTVVAKFHANQIALTLDWRRLLVHARVVFRAIAISNDAYLQLPSIVAALALGLFRRPQPPAKADFSWRRYLVFGFLTVAIYSVPHVMRSLYLPMSRHFMVYLPFLCLATGWSLRRFWLWRRPIAVILYVVLCGLLSIHWHPKRAAKNVSNGFLRDVLVNPCAGKGEWGGETDFQWADHAKCMKHFGRYFEKHYPEPTPVLACHPESAVLQHWFNGCVSRPVTVVGEFSAENAARWMSGPGPRLYLRGPLTAVGYSLDEVLERVPLRRIKSWRRHRAYYVLLEYDSTKSAEPTARSTEQDTNRR
ncbi:glycosyltransferase family 39 protein [Candidatus Sumerlaeota bacterium]|nr:glycosyltransferase family 39 protein [Candidatus Sumerlaeota bacterium]